MIIEMLLLAFIAIAVFVYVLAPIVFPHNEPDTAHDAQQERADDNTSEQSSVEKHPVHDLS